MCSIYLVRACLMHLNVFEPMSFDTKKKSSKKLAGYGIWQEKKEILSNKGNSCQKLILRQKNEISVKNFDKNRYVFWAFFLNSQFFVKLTISSKT